MLGDDVITAGTATAESMEIIQAHATLAGVLISPDRQKRGRGEISATVKWSATMVVGLSPSLR